MAASFLEHYYTVLRENPGGLFELYCDDSVCELAGVGQFTGAAEICGCLTDIYGGAYMKHALVGCCCLSRMGKMDNQGSLLTCCESSVKE